MNEDDEYITQIPLHPKTDLQTAMTFLSTLNHNMKNLEVVLETTRHKGEDVRWLRLQTEVKQDEKGPDPRNLEFV